MKVGVISTGSVPFIIRNGNNYSGIAIEIWEKIAKKLNIDFEYVELPNDADLAIEKLKNKEVDILVGPYTITEKRYKNVDFMIPFYMTSYCFASSHKTDYIQNYINLSKMLFNIIFLFLLVLFINNITKNLTKNANLFSMLIDSIPTFNKFDKNLWFLYFIVFICIFIIYINSAQPNFSFTSTNFLLNGKSVIFSDSGKVKDIIDKYKIKGEFLQVNSSADHIKQTNDDPLLNKYLLEKDSVDGIVGECSNISYILHQNSEKYNDIKIVRKNISRELYSFALPKESKYIDELNSTLRQLQQEKINQMIVTKYLGPDFENFATF
jgi:polar amino acid transport system substrate-binding protein